MKISASSTTATGLSALCDNIAGLTVSGATVVVVPEPSLIGLFSFSPRVAEGDSAVEDGFLAGDVVFGVCYKVSAALELAGVAGFFME